jgi:hypothetical protein
MYSFNEDYVCLKASISIPLAVQRRKKEKNSNIGILCIPSMRIACALRPPYPWLFCTQKKKRRNRGIFRIP